MVEAPAYLKPAATLTKGERIVAFVVAGVLVLAALLTYLHPPDREQAVDGCTAQPPSSCVVRVEETSTGVVTALLALGGASFLIGLIGVRFTSIKAGPVELGGTASEQKAEDVQKELKAGKLEPVGLRAALEGSPADVWSTLPTWVQSALYRWVADNPVIELPVDEAVTAAYKPAGQGNYAWSIQLQAADGQRTLRVSQGKGSSQAILD